MNIWRWIVRFILAAIAPSILLLLAIAQPAAPPNPEMAPACPGPVARDRAPVIPLTWRGAPNIGGLNSGAFNLAALNSDQVRLTFLGHATFLIESPQLVRIASDYKDYVKSPLVPDIVTMNHAPTRITPTVPIRRSNTCCAVGARPPISRPIGT